MPAALRLQAGRRSTSRAKCGDDARVPPKRGWDSVTVPGAVSAWMALSERFGSAALRRCSNPPSKSPSAAMPCLGRGQKWAMAAGLPELTDQPGFAEAFLPNERPRARGGRELFRFPAAARTLRADRRDHGAGLLPRRGGAGHRSAVAKAHGGAMTAADLEPTSPSGSGPSAATTPATACTRFRRTGRASPR